MAPSAFAPARRVLATAVGLVLVIAASVVGLDDWADGHLTAGGSAHTASPGT